MGSIQRVARILTLTGALFTAGACGTLSNILGGIGGTQQQPQSGQINGTVRSVDPNNQRINVQDNSNGQSYWIQYDNRTQVVYRGQSYPANSIRQGDNVSVTIQNNGNNNYYASYVQIN
ncbi:MAG: hypothetical protein ACXU9O_15950 [Gemmatimonadaceae bacterium]